MAYAGPKLKVQLGSDRPERVFRIWFHPRRLGHDGQNRHIYFVIRPYALIHHSFHSAYGDVLGGRKHRVGNFLFDGIALDHWKHSVDELSRRSLEVSSERRQQLLGLIAGEEWDQRPIN